MNAARMAFAVLWLMFGSMAMAQGILLQPSSTDSSTNTSAEQQATTNGDSPEEVKALLQLLANENVVRWLQNELDAKAPQSAANTSGNMKAAMARRLQQLRTRAADVMQAVTDLPALPASLQQRWQSGMTAVDTLRSVIYLLIFLFIGFGLEWLYWCYASLKLHQLELSDVSGLKASAERASTVGLLRLGGATLFSLGCVGTFLFFDWAELAGQVVLSVLFVAVSLRILLVASRVVFAPASEHLRMVPMSTPMARRCVFWIFVIAAVGLITRITADTFTELGINNSARISVYFLASAALAAVIIVAIWAWFSNTRVAYATEVRAGYALSSKSNSPYMLPVALTILTLVVLALDTLAMHKIKWLLVMIALLLPALAIARHLVDYYFDRALDEYKPASEADPVPEGEISTVAMQQAADQSVESQVAAQEPSGAAIDQPVVPLVSEAPMADESAQDTDESSLPFNIYRPVTQRLVRIVVIVSAVLALFAIVDLPLWMIYQSDGVLGRLVSAVLDVAAVLLLADLLWVWTKTLIDRRLSEFEAPAHGQVPGPGARMATLLPLFRKMVFGVIAVMVVLVLLSSFGVNIAPLLAGAGVIGIAVGFGAQALVKDVVSGVFFLLEDAFRVGEYIEMGELRGTVESISLRSLRVRHHLGAVHTIPYGELTSLTNHSRDWAIIKMEFRVPFDTDIKLVKKIVKKIGAELQKNEVYGHHIIEPLKSQGVRRMEEFNMVVGVKFMSEPGQQWTIRRDAYQAIRDAFDQHGLSFAERSVKVEVVGDGTVSKDAIAGAAQEVIDEQINQQPKVVDDTP
jgi:small-conductance mechanosensitive channel